ncbi:MAG: hypothetical protein R3C53_24255 [Pirellulaceae bacterium]
MTDTTASSPDSDPAKKTTSDVATATTTAAASQPAERGRRSALQSGFSLLARGEPQIWFTGGMLILCLAMIVGLLGLILVSGLPTFWPKRLDLIALDDGQLEIGQPQKLQVRTVSSQTGAEGPQKKETRPSRYYRTANADITGQHFRWIDPDQTAANGIASPEWAMVVERETWGRLHGLPLSLTETIPLPEDTLNELRQLDEFIDLIGTLRSVDSTEEMSQAAEELTELLVKTPPVVTVQSAQRDRGTVDLRIDGHSS